MKITLLVSCFMVFTTTSFTASYLISSTAPDASKELAHKTLEAFKRTSAQSFSVLYPSIEDIHSAMDANAAFYGNNLDEAKEEIAKNHKAVIIPAAKDSFRLILAQGRDKQIKWKEVYGLRTDCETLKDSTCRITIVFGYKGKEHKLVHTAMWINGNLRLEKFVELI
jgi:hypothetical protein